MRGLVVLVGVGARAVLRRGPALAALPTPPPPPPARAPLLRFVHSAPPSLSSTPGPSPTATAEADGEDHVGQLLAAVRSAIQSQGNTLHSLDKQQQRLALAPLHTQRAELIIANLHTLPADAVTATVAVLGPAGEETGETVALERQDGRSWNEEAGWLFKEAKRFRRGADGVEAVQMATRSGLARLEECEAQLCAWAAEPRGADTHRQAVFRLHRELKKRRLLRAPRLKPAKPPQAAEGATKGVREFKSPGGLTILVGRTQATNERLTLQEARKTDVWMHAEGPGAHVLLRCAVLLGGKGRQKGLQRAEPDAGCLQATADLAAFFSKQQGQGKVKVHSANPADISKPKGAPVGAVALRRARQLIGRPAAALPYLSPGEHANYNDQQRKGKR